MMNRSVRGGGALGIGRATPADIAGGHGQPGSCDDQPDGRGFGLWRSALHGVPGRNHRRHHCRLDRCRIWDHGDALGGPCLAGRPGRNLSGLLWLAYRIATAPPLTAQQATAKAPSLAGGTLLGIANPKAWVAIAAVFASARLAVSATADTAAKVALLTAIIALISVTWLVAGATLAPLLRHPVRARVINVVLAAALVGATVLALLS
jgi:hypothetical protein